MLTKIEFAVQMTCDSCVKAIRKSLEGVPGIERVDVNLATNTVVVETTLSTEHVLERLETSGRMAVVKGLAGSVAGVAIIEAGSAHIKGVVRFVQAHKDTCIIDGTIIGLAPGQHGLFIHESGDISKGCESVGDCFNPLNNSGRSLVQTYGNLGVIHADRDGKAAFRVQNDVVKLTDVIGRSLIVTERTGLDPGRKLACGIIARSSGMFQNPKTICACNGVSIWDERSKSKTALKL